MKTLVVKYPQILSKTEDDMREYFKIMNNYEINSTDAMDYLSQAPKIMAEDIEQKVKDITFIFEIYHGMTQKDVIEIFRAFPYMLCL